MEIDLESLCVAIRAGCRTSEEVLCNFLLPGLRLILKRRTQEHHLDAVQEALLAVLKAVREGTVRQPAALAGYARSAGLNILNRRFERDRFVQLHDASAKPDYLLEFEEARNRANLEGALRLLTETDRELVERFYLKEEPLERIAEDFRITLKAAQVRKSRVVGRLRDLVSQTKRMEELRRLAKPAASEVCVRRASIAVGYA